MKLKIHKVLIMLIAVFLGVAVLHAADAEKGSGKAIDDYNFAVWLYNGGKYGLAADSYASFLQNYPEHARVADARFGLAQALFHTDKFDQAAKEYEKVRADFSGFSQSAELSFQLGQTYVALNRFADAASLFAVVRDKYADHYLADWAMARQAACFVSMDKNKEAEALLKTFLEKYAAEDKAAEKMPGTKEMFRKLEKAGIKAGDAFLSLIERSVFYYALAQFNQNRSADAQKSFDQFLSRYPKSDLQEEARFRLAQSLYRQESYARATDAYEPISEGTGKFAESASFERGLSLYKAGKLKEASAAFAKMAERFPQSPQAPKASLYSGTFLFEGGNYKEAMERLEPIAKAGKKQADEAAYWIAMSLLKLGKAKEAEQAFSNAIRDFPKSAVVGDMRLGLADARLAQNKFESAAGAFQEFAGDSGKSEQAPRALYSACVSLHRADKYAESDELCGKFVDKFDKHELAPQVLFLSGENRFLLKKYDKAGDRYAEYLQKGDKAGDRVARAHYRMAWVHRYARKDKEALEELGKIDAGAAGEVIACEMKYLEGVLLFESGKYAPAVKALNTYLDARDHSRFGDDALLKLSVSEMKQDRKAQAAKSLEQFQKEYPQSELLPQVQYQLAECYYDQKLYSKAIEKYALVAGRDKPDELTPYAMFGIGLCAYDEEKWEEAAKAFGKMAEKYPKAELTPQALFRKSRSLVKLKQWAEAEKASRALIESFPKHELARTSLIAAGTCLQEQQKWAEAGAAFKAAAEDYAAGEDQARIIYEQAWSFRQAGKEDESLKAFNNLAEKFPKDPLVADAYFYLAEAKYKAKQDDPASKASKQRADQLNEAISLYRKVLDTGKDKRLADKAIYRIGWCCWLMEQYPKAAEEFDRLIKEFPGSELLPDALFQAGQSHAKAGKADMAAERFNKLIGDKKFESFEFLPDAYLGLANCLLILDKYDEVLDPMTALIKKYKEERLITQAHFLLGKARFHLKKYDDAMENFQEVTKRTKTETGAEAQFYIGQVLQSKNDCKGAIVAYLRVAALFRDHREWVAAATFESAKCYEAIGDKAQAKKTFEEVVNNYKDTKWAKAAAERL